MSVEVYERLKKIFEECIENEKIESKEIYAAIETINREALIMKAWCLENASKGFEKLCNDYEVSKSSITRILIQLALSKAVIGQTNIGEDEAGLILKNVLKVIEGFWSLTQKSLLLTDRGTLCRVLKPFQARYTIASPGYVTYLPLSTALHLSAIGFVEIIEVF